MKIIIFYPKKKKEKEKRKKKIIRLHCTPSVPLCLSSIPFWDVPNYCPVSKNKSY